MKVCTKCKILKDINEFNKDKYQKDGYQSRCRECTKIYYQNNIDKIKIKHSTIEYKEKRKEYLEQYYQDNKPEILEQKRQYNQSHKKEAKNYKLFKKFGITLEKRNEILENQGNCCVICKLQNHDKKDWCIDHNHTTGKIRGILCGNCNKGLGYFKDNINSLKEAIEYLEKHNVPSI